MLVNKKLLIVSVAFLGLVYIAPALLFSLQLLHGNDLPPLSVLDSERFWIYFVEQARTNSFGMLSWPGVPPPESQSFLYLERILIRLLLSPVPIEYFLVVDAALGFTLILLIGIYFDREIDVVAGFLPAIFFLSVLIIQPIHMLKAIILDPNVGSVWFARGAVAPAAFLLFLVGANSIVNDWKPRVALFCTFLLGLTHTYTFILLLIVFFLAVCHRTFFGRANISWGLNLTNCLIACLISAVLINTFLMSSSPHILFFTERYIPDTGGFNYMVLKDFSYLSVYFLATILIQKIYDTDKLHRKLYRIVLISVIAAVAADIAFLFYDQSLVNIHFRIYIIEILFILYLARNITSRLSSGRLVIPLGLVLALLLPSSQNFLNMSFQSRTNDINGHESSVHRFLFTSHLDENECTVFDKNSRICLMDRLDGMSDGNVHKWQWANALLHKRLDSEVIEKISER